MKKKNTKTNFSTLAFVALILAGYSAMTYHSRKVTESQDTAVTTEASESPAFSPAESPAPAVPDSNRFDDLIASFGDTYQDKSALVSSISAGFDERIHRDTEIYNELVGKHTITSLYNFIGTDNSTRTAQYSPMARFFTDYADKCSINPLVVADALVPTMVENSGFQTYTCDRTNAYRAPVVSDDCSNIIRTMLVNEFGDGDYTISYSETEGLYYTYLVSVDTNISVTGLYFRFNDADVLTNVGCDSFIFTGGELAVYNSAASYPAAIALAPDHTYSGSEPTVLCSMTDAITGILGSATSPDNVISGGTIRSDDRAKVYYCLENGTGNFITNGVYFSSWFALE